LPEIYDNISDDDLIDLMLKKGASSDGGSGLGDTQNRDVPVVPWVETSQNVLMGRRGGPSQRFDLASILKSTSIPAKPYYAADTGLLFEGDCLNYLPKFTGDLVDTVFADPPFNLGKTYGNRTNDSRADDEYVEWCQSWLQECVRVLAPGGSLFVYNLPKWSIILGAYLMKLPNMQFRHSIAIEMKSCLPIPGRLYPAHYALLYFTKGKPKTFRKIRTPIG
jgi:DNA methylase